MMDTFCRFCVNFDKHQGRYAEKHKIEDNAYDHPPYRTIVCRVQVHIYHLRRPKVSPAQANMDPMARVMSLSAHAPTWVNARAISKIQSLRNFVPRRYMARPSKTRAGQSPGHTGGSSKWYVAAYAAIIPIISCIAKNNAYISPVQALARECGMSSLTPREIVAELDKYVVGQEQAKRMVAVALRNRWRRQRLEPSLREEVAPKNIIMMGPTGVGKTEIARRLARLANAPFVKVEATKFTEVGYVGRDVESMIRDLMEIGINIAREQANAAARPAAEAAAESRLMDLLLPHSYGQEERKTTREKLLQQFRLGYLDSREVEMEIAETQSPKSIDIFAIPGMEQVGSQVKDMFSKAFPPKRVKRKMKLRDAYNALIAEETANIVDQDALVDKARENVEQNGIVFIDEIDKIASTTQNRNSDISREGVQRDLLPIVEGSTVNTKYGMVRTDHILFMAAGAFHFSKPSDMIPELQGRFPLRVELSALGKDEFLRILTEPDNALTRQYAALLATEQVSLDFREDGLQEIAAFAEEINSSAENIGARRLYTIMEKILADISFDAPEKPGETLVIDRDYVREHLKDIREDQDLSRYIL